VSELWSRLRAAFDSLSERERVLVASALSLVGLALLYATIISPALSFGTRAEAGLDAAKQQLAVVVRMRREYDDVRGRLDAVERRIARDTAGSLGTKLESLAQQSLVKIESIQPQSSPTNEQYREKKVEVDLKGVSLPQTVNYLERIEADSQVLSIKALRIRIRPEKPDLLDVTFTVSSFERI
jgi:type II secretory pathway component PulM